MTKTSERTDSPRLTIGMPVYRCAETVPRAIESLLAQTFRDFRLLISDDASPDDTAAVCESYAARDPRVVVVRQPQNLNYANFRYLVHAARTPFFMFAPGDDWWHPEYVERMIAALDAEPRAVCAVSRVAFMCGDEFIREGHGTRALTSPDPATNIAEYISRPDDNSRMCGVLRTDVIQRAFPPRSFHAFDWASSIGTLREGIHLEVPEVLLWRDHTDPSRYIEYVRRDARRGIDRIFPLFPLTRDIVGRLRIPMTRRVAAELFRQNVVYHDAYLDRYHPRAAALSRRVRRAGAFVARGIRAVVRRARRLVAQPNRGP